MDTAQSGETGSKGRCCRLDGVCNITIVSTTGRGLGNREISRRGSRNPERLSITRIKTNPNQKPVTTGAEIALHSRPPTARGILGNELLLEVKLPKKFVAVRAILNPVI